MGDKYKAIKPVPYKELSKGIGLLTKWIEVGEILGVKDYCGAPWIFYNDIRICQPRSIFQKLLMEPVK